MISPAAGFHLNEHDDGDEQPLAHNYLDEVVG